jgi:predicted transcriptional regulator
MAPTDNRSDTASAEAMAVTKAALRAAEKLGLTNRALAAVIGLSEPSISRMKKGTFALERGAKSFELGVLFVRLYRALDAIVSGDEEVARAWLHNENLALGGKPLDLMQSVAGLMNVIQYLDARRAPL